MDERWVLKPEPDDGIVRRLTEDLGLSRTLAVLLAQRGITNYGEARDFFAPAFTGVHDPFLMKDMDRAVDRILRAMERKERILVYGDYDVDGTTAVSLVYGFLFRHYDQLDFYIPDRYKEGYGLSYQGIDYADDNGVSLIIALDCGVKAVEQVKYGNERGIDFIICDHHLPGAELPPAVAVLDPKRADCSYPYDELSGCGVGFKLCQALTRRMDWPIKDLEPQLDLLALSIGADIVPITGENRVLAFFGMKRLNELPRPGLRALMGETREKLWTITDVVFQLGPKINAAGRMEHGKLAVELLTETQAEKAKERAEQIVRHNDDRRTLDQTITEAAKSQILALGMDRRKSTVVYHEEWNKGVIGIVASRLIEHYYKPTVVFTLSNGKLAGSARSVHGFDLYEALEACADVLEQFGGHRYAAGMTMLPERLETFRLRFEEAVAARITPEQETPVLEVDTELDLSEINEKFMRILKRFEPFGPGNLSPIFVSRGMEVITARRIGKEENHWKLWLDDGSRRWDAIGFGMVRKINLQPGDRVDVAYHLGENHYQGRVSLQLELRGIRPAY